MSRRPKGISASSARYIKLGRQDKWAQLCLADGTLRLGFYEVPHEIGRAGDRAKIKQIYLEHAREPGTASDYARQVVDFYHAPLDTIWITISGGFLYWCQAATEVESLGQDPKAFPDGSRLRRTLAGWKRKSLGGVELSVGSLDGRLTQISGYRSTICAVKELDYLLARINDEKSPELQRAETVRAQVLASITELIQRLYWKDFELLVDLIFSRSGWQRESVLGGTQKTVDMVLRLPSTGDRAMVQIKSSTDNKQFADYLKQQAQRGEERMFYVYHSSKRPLESPDRSRVTVIGPDELSPMVLTAGLFDWLINKAA